MGWNELQVAPESTLFSGVNEHPYVYFAHSFYLPTEEAGAAAAATAEYAFRFTAAIEKRHVRGTQFHPEKSGETGMQLLRNFAAAVEAR